MAWSGYRAPYQKLVENHIATRLPQKKFIAITRTVDEDELITAHWILAQTIDDQTTQAIEAAAHMAGSLNRK